MPILQDSVIAAPDVPITDDELIVQQILETRAVNGVVSPLAQLVGDRIFCPDVFTRANGERAEFKNDDPGVIFRIEDGGRSKANMVNELIVEFFVTGGRTHGKNEKLFAQAKQTYRALVHRLGLVDNEAVQAGALLGAFELSIGRAEVMPDSGWPAYRSRWRIVTRRKE